MNHHLRFFRQSARLSATGIPLLLSSCSTPKPEPPLAAVQKGLTYEIRIFDVPAKHPFGSQGIESMSPQHASDLLRKLDRQPSFSGVISAAPGQTKTLGNKRNLSTQQSGPLPNSRAPTGKLLVADFQSRPPHPSHFRPHRSGQPCLSPAKNQLMASST